MLNICEQESRLFLTKNRAPYLICLEIFRPEEVLLTSQNKYRVNNLAAPRSNSFSANEMPITNRLVDGTLINTFIGSMNQAPTPSL